MLKGIQNMQENFTMIKMTEISLTPMTKMRRLMQNVVLEVNKEFTYTLFSLCPLWKRNLIQRFKQIFCPNTFRIKPVDCSCLLFIFINIHEINMK